MYTVRFLLGLLCIVNAGSYGLFDGSSLRGYGLRDASYVSRCMSKTQLNDQTCNFQLLTSNKLNAQPHNPQPVTRNSIINIALSQLLVREVGGNNRGKEVQKFLDYVGLPAGSKWCAAYVSWVFGQAGYTMPRTGWSPNLFPSARCTLSPKPADVIGIYFPELGRIAHCGIIEGRIGEWVISIEGNTSVSGGRDGHGVERKWRHVKSIAKFADWTAEKGVSNVH